MKVQGSFYIDDLFYYLMVDLNLIMFSYLWGVMQQFLIIADEYMAKMLDE